MVARGDLELAEQVGEVLRERCERRVPRLGYRHSGLWPGVARGGEGANLGLAQQAPHTRLVEARKETPGGVRPLGAAGATHVEDELLLHLADVHGAEHLRRARQIAWLLGRQGQPDVLPACGQVLLERAPLIDELHRPSA